MSMYYVIVVLLTALSAMIWKDAILLSPASLAPLVGMGILLFVALMYRTGSPDMRENLGSTAYVMGDGLNEKEENDALHLWSKACFLGAPLHLPLILFGGTGVKTVGVLIIVLGTLAAASVGFRIKYQKVIRSRLNAEEEALRRQIQREEQGKL